ncbi:M16 family metallopeptidase [Rickettsiales bacterium LUAb2]
MFKLIRYIKFIPIFYAIIFIPQTVFGFEYYNFKLYNQLEFYLIKTNSPVVTYTTWVNAGGANERDKQGVAHFLEHMMFKDNKRFTGNKLQQILQNTGGVYNAFTNYDNTVYYETIPVYNINKIMEVDASRLKGLLLKPSQIEEERKVILEERGLRVDNVPISRFDEQINYYALNSNNYRRSLIGSPADINNINRDDILDFYNTYYRPSNIKIFVIGNISENKLKSLAQKYYNSIPNKRKEVHSYNFIGDTEYKNNVSISITDDKVLQDIYAVSYLAPSYRNAVNRQDALSLYILALYMNSQISDFYQNLVNKKKVVADVNVKYDYAAKLNTNFMVYLIPNDKKNNYKLIMDEYNKQISYLIRNGISRENFNLLVNQVKYNNTYLQDMQSDYVLLYASFIMNGFKTEEFLDFVNQVNNLKYEQVNSFIEKFLQQNTLTIKLVSKVKDNK